MPTVFRDNQVLKQIFLQTVPEKGRITDIVVQGGPIGNPVINGCI